jgi:dihydrofolate reductase
MAGTVWHCHIAVSLDGKIARPDGSVDDWLADYPAEDFGIDAFLAGVDAILMGRGTYEAVRGLGDWPYPGKSMIALGKLNVLEMAVIPIILGSGVPLFPQGTGEMNLRLTKCETKAKGALHLIYERTT